MFSFSPSAESTESRALHRIIMRGERTSFLAVTLYLIPSAYIEIISLFLAADALEKNMSLAFFKLSAILNLQTHTFTAKSLKVKENYSMTSQ
jgi:hypothetical protein